MKRLFGTDGIRGRAGEFPLDASTVRTIGVSLSRHLGETLGRAPRMITGRDTRESGEWIENAFLEGAASAGAECYSAGIITTPGVAFLTKEFEKDAGIVISASHNPYQDNGIKVFSPSGKKIDEETERKIERDIRRGLNFKEPKRSEADDHDASEFQDSYIRHLKSFVRPLVRDLKVVVDCANGAQSAIAPAVLGGGVTDMVAINCDPNGRNINDGCGSLHLEKLQAKVMDERADVGVAFDGDADRALFVNERGEVVDGDMTLWIMAKYLLANGKLKNSTVVATVMSNIGLELALSSIGVRLDRTAVGDKYVLDELLATGSELGGEQSGHIIFPEISLVGDGMITALMLLGAVVENSMPLSVLSRGFVKYPQILVNTLVNEKRPFDQVPEIAAAAKAIEGELGTDGRLLLRYSGTENLARVMIEGKDQTEIERQANRLADVIKRALG